MNKKKKLSLELIIITVVCVSGMMLSTYFNLILIGYIYICLETLSLIILGSSLWICVDKEAKE